MMKEAFSFAFCAMLSYQAAAFWQSDSGNYNQLPERTDGPKAADTTSVVAAKGSKLSIRQLTLYALTKAKRRSCYTAMPQ